MYRTILNTIDLYNSVERTKDFGKARFFCNEKVSFEHPIFSTHLLMNNAIWNQGDAIILKVKVKDFKKIGRCSTIMRLKEWVRLPFCKLKEWIFDLPIHKGPLNLNSFCKIVYRRHTNLVVGFYSKMKNSWSPSSCLSGKVQMQYT